MYLLASYYLQNHFDFSYLDGILSFWENIMINFLHIQIMQMFGLIMMQKMLSMTEIQL